MDESSTDQLLQQRHDDSLKRRVDYKRIIEKRKERYSQLADIQTKAETSLRDLDPQTFRLARKDVSSLDAPDEDKKVLGQIFDRLGRFQVITTDVHDYFVKQAKRELGEGASDKDVRKMAGKNFFNKIAGQNPQGQADIFVGPAAVVLYLNTEEDFLTIYSSRRDTVKHKKSVRIGQVGFYRNRNTLQKEIQTTIGTVDAVPIIVLHADVYYRDKDKTRGGDKVLKHESTHSVNRHIRDVLDNQEERKDPVLSNDVDVNIDFVKHQCDLIRLADANKGSLLHRVGGELAHARLDIFAQEIVRDSLSRCKDEIVAGTISDTEIEPRISELVNGTEGYNYFTLRGMKNDNFHDDPEALSFIEDTWAVYTGVLTRQAAAVKRALKTHPDRKGEIVAVLRERPISKWSRELRRIFPDN